MVRASYRVRTTVDGSEDDGQKGGLRGGADEWWCEVVGGGRKVEDACWEYIYGKASSRSRSGEEIRGGIWMKGRLSG